MDPLQILVGQEYVFDDGNFIKIIQIKMREEGYWVTYLIGQPNTVAQKLVMPYEEFATYYGHLF